MRTSLFLVAACAALAFPAAAADGGVRPTWTDFQPAVSTQYRPPDGGRTYPKPDTQKLISASDRRANERQQAEMDRRAASPPSVRGRSTTISPSAAPIAPPASTSPDPLATPTPSPQPIPTPNPIPRR